MNTRFISTVCALVLVLCIPAKPLFAQKVGTSSLQFLKVMPTARATAMGEAFAAVAWGVDGVFWNPAAVAGVRSHELSTTYTLWLFDTKQSAIGYATPLFDWGHVGLQLQFTDVGDIEETRVDHLTFVGSGGSQRYNPGLTGRVFSPRSWVVGLSFARQMTDRFSAGLTAKYVSESLWDNQTVSVLNSNGDAEIYNTFTRAFLFDFGMHYNTGFRSLHLGVSVQNFGAQVRFAKESYPAPLTFRLGIVGNVVGADALILPDDNNTLTVAYDIAHPNDYDQQMHFGTEYVFANLVSLRAGYKLNYDSERWTFGGGVRTDLLGFGVNFDYGYGDLGRYLGQVHRLTLGVKFP